MNKKTYQAPETICIALSAESILASSPYTADDLSVNVGGGDDATLKDPTETFSREGGSDNGLWNQMW